MHPASPYIFQAFGEPLFNERLRRQNHAVTFQLNFQIVPRRQPQLIVNPLGNDHLTADTDLDS